MTQESQRVIKPGKTDQAPGEIKDAIRRNFWLSAEEAKKYGIVGKVIKEQKELVGKK